MEVRAISLPKGGHKTRDVGISRSWERQGDRSPLEPPEGMEPF